MAITSIAGADLIGAIGQALAPIPVGVLGFNPTLQGFTGLFVLILMAGILVIREAPMELMALILFPSAIIFSYWGWLPVGVGIVVGFIGATIIALAIIRFRQS